MNSWKKKEEQDKKDFSGRRQRGSGNFWSRPGDIKTDQFLIDSKQTEKKSYSISLKTWDKIYEEALFSFRIPILSLLIQDLELVILSKTDFLTLIKKDT